MAKKSVRKDASVSLFDGDRDKLIEQLCFAYRKAKADVFYETAQPFAIEFHDYEIDLLRNLNALADRLIQGKWETDEGFIGGLCCIPKGGLRFANSEKQGDGPRISLSDPRTDWEEQKSKGGISVEFRPIAHFTVDMYVTCALWVNLIGHKFDACLDKSAYGSRVRRFATSNSEKTPGYHFEAQGTFEPYFFKYRDWRENGLKSIRTELRSDRDVVAMTMDVTSFYHSIDPKFLLKPRFLKAIEFNDANGSPLSRQERFFTKQIIKAFETWAKKNHVATKAPLGVPVGPAAARIIANVLLCEFDKQIQQQLSPVYYGRYVDDIFLVLRDHGQFGDARSIINWLVDRVDLLHHTDNQRGLKLALEYGCKSKLIFKNEKQRLFQLSGGTGHDLLDTIESKIDEVSSEHRMLPELDALTKTPAAKVLTGDGSVKGDHRGSLNVWFWQSKRGPLGGLGYGFSLFNALIYDSA